MLKVYLSTQTSFLSSFMISKTHIAAEKPRERQLNASESATFVISFFIMTTMFSNEKVQLFTVILA